jgi:hypothetical protein
MHVEWQGDHKMLGDDVERDFERELKKLGFDPSKFLVEVIAAASPRTRVLSRKPSLPLAWGCRE